MTDTLSPIAARLKVVVDAVLFAQARGRRFRVDKNELMDLWHKVTELETNANKGAINGSQNTTKPKSEGENFTKGSSIPNPKEVSGVIREGRAVDK